MSKTEAENVQERAKMSKTEAENVQERAKMSPSSEENVPDGRYEPTEAPVNIESVHVNETPNL